MNQVANQVDISKALTIPGWMSERELTWLAMRAQECNIIVEFGSFYGRSTRALADNTDGVVYAVDPWNGDYPDESGVALKAVNTYVMPQFVRNLEDHIANDKVFPVRGYSFNFVMKCSVDMVFIDGDHRYESVKKDILKAQELLRDGGIICGHDYNHPLWTGVNKAVHELLGKVQVEDTIWWKVKY